MTQLHSSFLSFKNLISLLCLIFFGLSVIFFFFSLNLFVDMHDMILDTLSEKVCSLWIILSSSRKDFVLFSAGR